MESAMTQITQNGIDYIAIPKKDFEQGKFLNKIELTRLQNSIQRQRQMIDDFLEGLE